MNKKIFIFALALTLFAGVLAGSFTEKNNPAVIEQDYEKEEVVSTGYIARLEGSSVNIYYGEDGEEQFSHNIEGVNTLCLPEITVHSLKNGIKLENEEKLQKFIEEITS